MGEDAKMTLLEWFKTRINKPGGRRKPGEAAGGLQEAEAPPEEKAAAPAGQAPVLIAEDHPVSQKLFSIITDKLGYPSVLAGNGQEAFEKALAQPVSLVFMDIQMPGMNGCEAAAKLREAGFGKPIIAVTAGASRDEWERCRRAGMNGILYKPFKRADVQRALEKWLKPTEEAPASPDVSAGEGAVPPGFVIPVEEADIIPATKTRAKLLGPSGGGSGKPEPLKAKEGGGVIFSPTEVADTFPGNEETACSLLEHFLERTRGQLEAFPALLAADREAARREAHTVKGAALTLSGGELGGAAARLEGACKNADNRETEAAYKEAGEAFARFRLEAGKFLESRRRPQKKAVHEAVPIRYSCIHTHTHFCDGKGDVESFCLKALEKGFDSLGFSAHAPIFRKTGIATDWHLREERLEAYLDEVRAAQRRWEGRLRVYLGLEVDFIPGLMGPAGRDYRDMGLDYIIGSVHFVVPPRGAPFTVDGPPEELEQGVREGWGGDAEGMVNAYWDSIDAMLRAGGLDVLGHPDLIKKNNLQNRWFSEEDEFYRLRTAAAAALASQTGVTVEINTGGMNRKKIPVPYPSLPFLRLFRENGVPMVINADAHCPEDLDGHYGEAREALLSAGYTGTALFEGRKDGLAQWRTEKLL